MIALTWGGVCVCGGGPGGWTAVQFKIIVVRLLDLSSINHAVYCWPRPGHVIPHSL